MKDCTSTATTKTFAGNDVCTVGTAAGLGSALWYKATIVAPVDIVQTTVATTKATSKSAMKLVASVAASGALMSSVY